MPVSLHTHSWYSLLEGVTGIEALLERSAALGQGTLALTDTNNLYGAVAFTELAHRYGIRPLLGACLRQQRSQREQAHQDCGENKRFHTGPPTQRW